MKALQYSNKQFDYECELLGELNVEEIDYIPTPEEAEELLSHAKTEDELRDMIGYLWYIAECYENEEDDTDVSEKLHDLNVWLRTKIELKDE